MSAPAPAAASAYKKTNPDNHLNPKVDKILNNVTRYVSKPLGLDKIYTEDQMKKRGNNIKIQNSFIIQFIFIFFLF